MKICELLAEALPRSDWIFPDGRFFLSDHFFDRMDERVPEVSTEQVRELVVTTSNMVGSWITTLHDAKFVIVTRDGFKILVIKKELPNAPGEYEYVAATILSPNMKLSPDELAVKIPVDL